MPMTINNAALNTAIQAIASVSKRDAIHPAASMAFISSENGSLVVKATDMDNWLSLSVPADGDIGEPIQVDAAKLADLVGKLSGDAIKMDVAGGYLNFASGRSKRKLAGVATVYPEIGTVSGDSETLDADTLRSAIGFASPSIASEDRPTFHGVRIQGGMAVSYNGSGFAGAPLPVNSAVTLAPSTIKLLKWMPEGDVSLTVADRLLSIRWDDGEIVSKTVEGAWSFLEKGLDAVMPDHTTHLVAQPSAIMAAINAVSAVAADDKTSKSKMVTLALSADGCEVSVASSAGSATEPLDAAWDGEPLQVNLSAGRLRQVLSGFNQDKDVTIGIAPLDGAPKGCVFRQDAMTGYVGMLAQIR